MTGRKNESKAQFFLRVRRKAPGLSRAECEERWKQHLESIKGSVGGKALQPEHGPSVRAIVSSGAKLPRHSLQPLGGPGLSLDASRVVHMLTDITATGIRIAPIIGGGSGTGLFTSIQIFDLSTTNDSSADGRFAGIFCPRMGVPNPVPEGFDKIDTYANYLVSGTSEYPTTNWRSTSNFEGSTNTGSIVKDLDFAEFLTRYQESRAELDGANTMTPAMPFGTAPTLGSSSPATFRPTMTDDGTNSVLILPNGTWELVFDITGTGLTALTLTAQGDGSVFSSKEVITATKILKRVVFTCKDSTTDSVLIVGTGTTVTASDVNINTYLADAVTDHGAIKTIRPLAMQVLASPTAPTLDMGGKISVALMPQDYLKTNAIVQSAAPGAGSPFFWENVARINAPHNVATFPFRKGAYAWYLPQDVSNMDFVTPCAMSTLDYPAIVVSGRYEVSGGGATGTTQPLRVVVKRIFEYTTDNQALDVQEPEVPYSAYLEATQYLSRMSRVSGNKGHHDLLRDIGKDLHRSAGVYGQFLKDWGPLLSASKNLVAGLLM